MSGDKVFDLDGVMERLDNDKVLLKEIVQIFFESLGDSLSVLQTTATRGEGYAFGAAAHSIKGALGNIGAMRAYRKAYELETKGKNNVMDNASALVDELKSEIAAYKEEYDRAQL